MQCYVGIDLGSTTSKAVVMDADGGVLGRGITNSRSNYDTATQVAKMEAMISARLTLLRRELKGTADLSGRLNDLLDALERNFRLELTLDQLDQLQVACEGFAANQPAVRGAPALKDSLDEVFARLNDRIVAAFRPGTNRKSDFFRDIVGSEYMQLADEVARAGGAPFDMLVNLYDKSIIEVENTPLDESIEGKFLKALDRVAAEGTELPVDPAAIRGPMRKVLEIGLEEAGAVGTGYGRVRLPFRKDQIRSEILCHGLGAHLMYPGTRTVLDIGGQDTKGIQVDADGIVVNFQMNDRCAAGCGRYLGYIADEMNVGLQELGPIALQATKSVRINSTCTVFAGAELRDRLAMGEKRADILAGLHRSIILRAMSIISRSGGITDEFTFTGGVAKNEAAVKELKKLVKENYGDMTINIDPESIYTGALGAAEFARRSAEA